MTYKKGFARKTLLIGAFALLAGLCIVSASVSPVEAVPVGNLSLFRSFTTVLHSSAQ